MITGQRKCQDCHKYRTDVQNVIDPYASDVDGEIVRIKVCDDCLERRSEEI